MPSREGNSLASLVADPGKQECVRGWRTIDSAPKDGTMVDLWCRSPGISAGPDRIPDCWFSGSEWRTHDPDADEGYTRVYNVKYWMPRPIPPNEQDAGVAGPPASAASHPSLASVASVMLGALERVDESLLLMTMYAKAYINTAGSTLRQDAWNLAQERINEAENARAVIAAAISLARSSGISPEKEGE